MFEPRAKTTTLTLKSDGSITLEEVGENLDSSSKNEVAAFARDAIDKYNESVGEKKISYRSCSVSEDEIYLKSSYADAKTYSDFTGLSLFCGTIKQAAKQGYLFNNAFVSVSGEEKKDAAEKSGVKAEKDKNVIIIDQPMRVVLPSDVVYVSRDGTTLESNRIVEVEGDSEVYIVY